MLDATVVKLSRTNSRYLLIVLHNSHGGYRILPNLLRVTQKLVSRMMGQRLMRPAKVETLASP